MEPCSASLRTHSPPLSPRVLRASLCTVACMPRRSRRGCSAERWRTQRGSWSCRATPARCWAMTRRASQCILCRRRRWASTARRWVGTRTGSEGACSLTCWIPRPAAGSRAAMRAGRVCPCKRSVFSSMRVPVQEECVLLCGWGSGGAEGGEMHMVVIAGFLGRHSTELHFACSRLARTARCPGPCTPCGAALPPSLPTDHTYIWSTSKALRGTCTCGCRLPTRSSTTRMLECSRPQARTSAPPPLLATSAPALSLAQQSWIAVWARLLTHACMHAYARTHTHARTLTHAHARPPKRSARPNVRLVRDGRAQRTACVMAARNTPLLNSRTHLAPCLMAVASKRTLRCSLHAGGLKGHRCCFWLAPVPLLQTCSSLTGTPSATSTYRTLPQGASTAWTNMVSGLLPCIQHFCKGASV